MASGSWGDALQLSWWDILAVIAFAYMVYRILKRKLFPEPEPALPKRLPKMKKTDFTVEQLKAYDGSNEEGRILMACDGTVFDVSPAASKYGPDGPYHVFAGRDASRGLATFDLSPAAVRETYDDLAGLDESQKVEMKEWANDFRMRYPVVGKLLKPDEQPTHYESSADEGAE